MRLFSILTLIIIAATCSAQTIVGHVIGNDSLPVSGASVSVKKNGLIIAYAITTSDGSFFIKLPPDSLFVIEVSHIAFRQLVQTIHKPYPSFLLQLQPAQIVLPDITVQQKPIRQNGDTIDYQVQTFAIDKDRVIGDVIKRLPGIEVTSGGQIRYNGVPISNYYIEGLDLLESKYSIANNNIPYNLVEKVQVLEKNQPVKVLDSNAAFAPALNIKLKPGAQHKFIGTIKAGTGAAPLLYDNALMAMRFGAGQQYIAGYKNNNTGDQIENELANQVVPNNYVSGIYQESKKDLLSLAATSEPDIAKERYYNNRSHLFYVNRLKVINPATQLRTYISYSNNNERQSFSSNTLFYTDSGKIAINEAHHKFSNTNQLQANIGFTVNKKSLYLKNTLKIEDYIVESRDYLTAGLPVNQLLKHPFYQFSNSFNAIVKVGKKLWQFDSYVAFKKTPQHLAIEPGIFPGVFNAGIAYNLLLQNVTLNSFTAANSVSHKWNWYRLQVGVSSGITVSSERYTSGLQKKQEQKLIFLNDSFSNNLYRTEVNLYNSVTGRLSLKHISFNFELPLVYNTLLLSDRIKDSMQQNCKLFFNPSVRLQYLVSKEVTLNLSYSTRSQLDDITSTTTGFILNNYRSVTRNNLAYVLEKKNAYGISGTYRNTATALFMYGTVVYSPSVRNTFYNQFFTGILENRTAIYIDNPAKNIFAAYNIGKYFLFQRTNVSASYNFNNVTVSQLTNSIPATISNQVHAVNVKISNKALSFLSPEYAVSYIRAESSIQIENVTAQQPTTYTINQSLAFNFTINKENSLSITQNQYSVRSTSAKSDAFFTDLFYRHKFKRFDAELHYNNITNTRSYINNSFSANAQTVYKYDLRPTLLMITFFLKF